MPNIFDGFRQISDKDLIEQIALLETVNINNISKPIIQKAKKKTISIINFLGSKIGKSNVLEEPEVKEIWTLIDENKEELKNCERRELEERLLDILVNKVKIDEDEPTEDAISIKVLEECSKLYKIYERLTPSQKADIIYIKYNEKLKGKAQEIINDQPFIDLQEATESIEEIINNMDEKQKKEFVQSVEIENLTLLNIWKNVDRKHFARLIWLAVKACGGRFTPKEEMLPSFVEKDNESEILQRDEELKRSQKELLEIKAEIESCTRKINDIENKLEKENKLYSMAIRNKNQAEEDIKELEQKHIKLEELKKLHEDKVTEVKDKIENAALVDEVDSLTDEFRKVKFDLIDINNALSDVKIEFTYKNELIEESIEQISNKEETIKQIGNEFKQLKIDAENIVEVYNVKKREVNKKEEIKRSEIFEKWTKFFGKFTFEFNDLGNIVNFSRKELVHIEEGLYELHNIKDPMALSMGIIEETESKKGKDEYQYIDIVFPDKFKVEIQYKVLSNEEKTLRIMEITTQF